MFCQITLVGNVGRDPELRYTPSGMAVCNFSLATNRRWNDREGNKQEETTWWKITVWGSQAETVNQYVSKGKQVLVYGDRVEASAYMGNDGQPRASLELTARDVRFLSGGGGGGFNGDDRYTQEPPGGYGDYNTPQDVDDIPF